MADLIKHYRQLLGIAKTWATANLAGWCDETHRDLIARHGAVPIDGRISASSMNMPQLAAALEDYERRGWPRQHKFMPGRRTTKPAAAKPVPPQIGHIVRLWGKAGQAGKVSNATRPALLAWCGRQVGRTVPDLDSLSTDECQKLIEALKGWMAR